MDIALTWQWLAANASSLAAIAALTSIAAFVVRNLMQLYSAISLNETVGRVTAFVLRAVAYVGDRVIWIFVGIVVGVTTDAFNFLAGQAT